MQSFDFQLRPRIVFGQGGLSRLGQLARELIASRVLVVSDPGVVAAGHFQAGVEHASRRGAGGPLIS